ncbi:CinA family protein [Methylophilus flavus]|jgi:nicotinamide-nucleotide amidase|uniref:CinA family protein n=1 Tax=Methylophilus flavus TaxID=640084 RepID=A0ABW3PBC0_9PROT
MQALEELSADLGYALQAKGWQLALAESCTGGMVAEAVTAVAGSSAWFDRGFVTYSNEAKVDMLGVPTELIQVHGAVSEQVAKAMAIGALQHSRAQISSSVTGIAGPTGGSLQKPVGTVCFGWAIRGLPEKSTKLIVETRHFDGNRAYIRQQAASYVLTGLLNLIETAGD